MASVGISGEDKAILDRIFTVVDVDMSGGINLREFVVGLSLLARGSAVDRIKFAFSMADTDKDGKVSADQLRETLGHVRSGCEWFGDEVPDNATLNQLVADAMKQASEGEGGTLSLESFALAVAEHPEMVRYIVGAGKAAVHRANRMREALHAQGQAGMPAVGEEKGEEAPTGGSAASGAGVGGSGDARTAISESQSVPRRNPFSRPDSVPSPSELLAQESEPQSAGGEGAAAAAPAIAAAAAAAAAALPRQVGRCRPVIVCGPSGVGKSTLINRVIALHPDVFGFGVSHTTRAPRAGEQDGVHYVFSSEVDMQAGIERGDFLEHASVHGHMYGTSKEAVQRVSREGKVCVLDIDVQGTQQC